MSLWRSFISAKFIERNVFMDKVCDAEEYRGPVKLTFLDRTIFCAYKIRFPIPQGCG